VRLVVKALAIDILVDFKQIDSHSGLCLCIRGTDKAVQEKCVDTVRSNARQGFSVLAAVPKDPIVNAKRIYDKSDLGYAANPAILNCVRSNGLSKSV